MLIVGKNGFEVIRYALKRLPDQPPLPNGMGEPTPEPNYESEEWLGWEQKIYGSRAEEVLAIKKEESPLPEVQIPKEQSKKPLDIKVKLESMY